MLHELQANEDDNQEHCETQTHYDSKTADVEKESRENLLRSQRRRSRGPKGEVSSFRRLKLMLRFSKVRTKPMPPGRSRPKTYF